MKLENFQRKNGDLHTCDDVENVLPAWATPIDSRENIFFVRQILTRASKSLNDLSSEVFENLSDVSAMKIL